jgi:hypothetical protein
MHFQFLHHNLDHTDPEARVAAIDRSLANAEAHLRTISTVHASLATELADIEQRLQTERGDRRGLEDRLADLRVALQQLERGVRQGDGTLPEVTPFLNTAGLSATREAVDELTRMRPAWVQLRDEGGRKALYRLKPDVGAHYMSPGVRLLAGEATELTLRQYRAWEDKFEPVEAPSEAPIGA